MAFTITEKMAMKDKCAYSPENLEKIKKAMIPNYPKKTAIIMVGLPGSGKSTVKNIFIRDYLKQDPRDFIDCDPDNMMQQIDKYNDLLKSDKVNAASICYYNASEINDIIYTFAQRNGHNIILDGTGQDYIWTAGQIENLYAIGYTIYICIVQVSADVAIKRTTERAEKTGRTVPPERIKTIDRNLQEAIGLYKKNKRAENVVIYDNNKDIPSLIYDKNK